MSHPSRSYVTNCARKECGVSFKTIPSEKKKYCTRECYYLDPTRREHLSRLNTGAIRSQESREKTSETLKLKGGCKEHCTCERHSSRHLREFTCERCKTTKQQVGTGRTKTLCDECLGEEAECECGCGKIVVRGYGYVRYAQECMGKINAHFLPTTYGEENPSCRPEVRDKLRQMRLGDKNPNWNANWSWSQYAPYQKVFYACKVVVWKRDSSTCQCCGLVYNFKVKKRTHVVHHIDEDPAHNVVENLILLCRSCHRNVHSGTIECPRPKYWPDTYFGDIRISSGGGTEDGYPHTVH